MYLVMVYYRVTLIFEPERLRYYMAADECPPCHQSFENTLFQYSSQPDCYAATSIAV